MPREVVITGPERVELLHRDDVKLARDEVRVRSIVSGISSATELRHYRAGPAPGTFSVRPGYELVGRVVECGSAVASALEGRVVWLDHPHAEEAVVRVAGAGQGLLGNGTAPSERLVFLARTRTALNAVHDSSLRLGERVVVFGLGTLGLLVARLAVLGGASQVLAADPVAVRRARAGAWGAEPVAPDVVPDAKADVVFEASGSAAALADAVDACAPYGRIVVVSTYALAQLEITGKLAVRQLTMTFSTTRPGVEPRQGPAWPRDRKLVAARELLESGRVAAEELITDEFAFDDAGVAYPHLAGMPEGCVSALLRYRDEPA